LLLIGIREASADRGIPRAARAPERISPTVPLDCASACRPGGSGACRLIGAREVVLIGAKGEDARRKWRRRWGRQEAGGVVFLALFDVGIVAVPSNKRWRCSSAWQKGRLACTHARWYAGGVRGRRC
jgi:hypothetical protein